MTQVPGDNQVTTDLRLERSLIYRTAFYWIRLRGRTIDEHPTQI